MKRWVANVALKTAIFASGKHQYEIADQAGIRPAYLSAAVYGRVNLTGRERARLAKILGKPQAELFPSDEAVAS